MTVQRHSFTIPSDGISNRLLSICRVGESWTPEDAEPRPLMRQYKALWDTGATNSLITKRVVDDLGLTAEGYSKIYHVGGSEENVPRFFVNLKVFDDSYFAGVSVFQGGFVGSDVLIGMDIVNRGDFAVSNKGGATKFSFRVPSVEDFDFIAEDRLLG